MPRARKSWGGGKFVMSEVLMHSHHLTNSLFAQVESGEVAEGGAPLHFSRLAMWVCRALPAGTKSRVERLNAKVEPLLTYVTVDYSHHLTNFSSRRWKAGRWQRGGHPCTGATAPPRWGLSLAVRPSCPPAETSRSPLGSTKGCEPLPAWGSPGLAQTQPWATAYEPCRRPRILSPPLNRCRSNSPHTRQSRPDSGDGLKATNLVF